MPKFSKRVSMIFLLISLTLGFILMQKNFDTLNAHDLEYVRHNIDLGTYSSFALLKVEKLRLRV